MTQDWEAVRGEFPALRNWTFLNTATFGQLPRRATAAIAAHFEHRDREACWDFLDWFGDADQMRTSVSRLIGCKSEDVGFATNAASGLAALLNGMDWRPGDGIVTLADEFPNNLYNPAALAERGVEAEAVPWERFHDAVRPRTRLVVFSMVNYITGFRPPLEEVSEFLRERGIILCVDGTQTLGALQLDVSRLKLDALVVDAYKWMLGPTGSGFVYFKPELRRRLRPTVIGWRSHRDWRNVDNLHHGAPKFKDAGEKFEGGMLAFGPLYGMDASIRMMLELGPERIEARVLELAAAAKDVLRELGATLLSDAGGHYRSPIVAASFPGRDAALLARALHEKRVLVSARHGYLRVSTHFYNNESDLEALKDSLRAVL